MFLFRDRISQRNIAYLVMTDCKKQEKISLFKHVLREIAMVSHLNFPTKGGSEPGLTLFCILCSSFGHV